MHGSICLKRTAGNMNVDLIELVVYIIVQTTKNINNTSIYFCTLLSLQKVQNSVLDLIMNHLELIYYKTPVLFKIHDMTIALKI